MILDREQTFGSRRKELADLLHVRRLALKAQDIGILASRRRRTPGLRREEVADLAGVSYSLYVALEQGREIPVSPTTIEAIARALRFTESERLYALRLVERTESRLRETVTVRLERFVTASATPMYVLDHGWDIILANDAAIVLFGISGDRVRPQNALAHAYLYPGNRLLFENWRTMARSLLEAFRMEVAEPPIDPRAVALVEQLVAESPEFAEDWKEHRVREHPEDVYRLQHPHCGALLMEPSAYRVLESPNLRIIAFSLIDDESIRKVRDLRDRRRARTAHFAPEE